MAQTVKIWIDDKPYDVPAGSNLVDVAKWHAHNDIPVFCYHPKMAPVGMCRMCLVEQGSAFDPATKSIKYDDNGNPVARWMPKLQTACTQTVAEGMTVRTSTKIVEEARRNVVEFLLTSHPLDCPICDKGGECPLQNLTMEHGPGASRMNFSDKLKLDKHVPLGEVGTQVFLDEERCIQCARCVRFQEEIVGDPVLSFHERGRTLQIITDSQPFGFDTYFSGNTTDICPVGALTTADFRFGARPWELTNIPSVCAHCAVGCNTNLSTRLDRDFGGRAMIKRVMPRQNEHVNEMWICDKGRFGHHYTRSNTRLQHPMKRSNNGALAQTTWGEAFAAAVSLFKSAPGDVAVIAASNHSTEDYYALAQLVHKLGGKRLGVWPHTHGGADIVAQVGITQGSNLGQLSKGDAIIVIASDIEEEAPIWRLRIKQAHDRGAYVAVANLRETRMEAFANTKHHYGVGGASDALAQLGKDEHIAKANNLVIFAGAEGLTLSESSALMQACANLLIDGGRVGKVNNGLIGVFPGANRMGAHYMGFSAEATADIIANPPHVLILAGADVMADDPMAAEWLGKAKHVISLSLFQDDATGGAALALPIQSFAERDGTFVNGERRVQRFYAAQGPLGEALPLWQLVGRIAEQLQFGRVKLSAAALFLDLAKEVSAFNGLNYGALSKVERQYPEVGGSDLYYGGTSYKNTGGIGVQLPATGGTVAAVAKPAKHDSKGKLTIVPTTRLYNRERVFLPTTMAQPRVLAPYISLSKDDAKDLGVAQGDVVEVSLPNNTSVRLRAHVNGVAKGLALVPRNLSDCATPLTITTADVKKV
jgi:NADH-quinone oxidoreductase subunit G